MRGALGAADSRRTRTTSLSSNPIPCLTPGGISFGQVSDKLLSGNVSKPSSAAPGPRVSDLKVPLRKQIELEHVVIAAAVKDLSDKADGRLC